MTTIETAASRLAKAVTLGKRVKAIRNDQRLWRLSRDSWIRAAMEMGDFVHSLDEVRHRLEPHTSLRNEIEVRAALWVRNDQPEPAPWAGFGPENPDPSIWTSMCAIHFDRAQCSALAALHTVELRDPAWWGSADSLDDGPAALRPHLTALSELDEALHTTVRLADLTWANGRPTLRSGDVEIEVTQDTAGRIASAMAEAAMLTVEDRAPAA